MPFLETRNKQADKIKADNFVRTFSISSYLNCLSDLRAKLECSEDQQIDKNQSGRKYG